MKHSDGNKFSPWRVYLGGAVVCAALSAAAYCVGVRPATRRHADQVARQAELRAAKQKANNLAGQLNTARADLARVNDTIARSSLRLEPVTQVNQRLSRLTALADGITPVKLTIDEMRPFAVAEGPDYKTVPIYIAGNGTYSACAAFLHGLRESFPDMAVVSFDTMNNTPSTDGPPSPEPPAATFQFTLAWHAAKN